MNNDQCISSLKEQLYNAEVAYSWESIGAGLKHENLVNWLISIFAGYSMLAFLWFVSDELTLDTIEFWGIFAISTMFMLISRYLFFPINIAAIT